MPVTPTDLRISAIRRTVLSDALVQKCWFHKHITHIYFAVPKVAVAGLRIALARQNLDEGVDTLVADYLLVDPGNYLEVPVALLNVANTDSTGKETGAFLWVAGDGGKTEFSAMAMTKLHKDG